jgi:bisphosphoglycerate-independent phosphoglycerate mutase (AlkP superfamily)
MNSNTDFYKKAGFLFLGVIVVLLVAKFTIADRKVIATKDSESYQQNYSYEKIDKVISWQEADRYYGKIVTVEGVIVKTYNSGKVVFLNFHPDYKRYFTAVIFKSAFSKFPNNPEDYYKNKKVQITGLIKNYQGSPEIILNDPEQIKVIGN